MDALRDTPQVVRFQDVHEKAAAYMSREDLLRIQRAYVFSAKAHEGQSRRSGEPYLVHPIAVAEILADLRLDPVTVIAGFLHDVLEDTAVPVEEIERLFGEDVARVVDGVTKIGQLDFSTKEEVQAESFRKMLLAMSADLRVIIVKLADRLHNMRTLSHMPRAKQLAVARETMDIYMPIAHRLGMGRLRHELEDLAFRHAEPERYRQLEGQLEERRRVEKGFIRRTEKELEEALAAAGVEAEIQGRRKSLASINRKLLARRIGIEEVYDYIAFRLVVDSVRDCYGALGVIHARWTPIQARFKDFIATPKPNGYRSLHTTVLSDDGHPFEVQIRTSEMHLVADQGVAAHWGYKSGATPTPDEAERYAWVRTLIDAQQDHDDPREFMQAVKLDLFGDEVFCFTPKGEVKVLKTGSTAIDFAYAIHTEVGHQCVGARIDGQLVPLRTPLQHGNRVEILTSPSQRPRRDWLKFAATSRARSKIRAWFHAREREEAVAAGRQVLERLARRAGTTAKRLLRGKEAERALEHFSFREPEDLLLAIGRDKLNPQTFVNRVRPGALPSHAPRPGTPGVQHASMRRDRARRRPRPQRGPVVAGEGELLTSLARCCHPVRGEPIRGYVTRGRGVTVHRADCRGLKAGTEDDRRLIRVDWDARAGEPFDIPLRVHVSDRAGILGDVTGAVSALDTNIRSASARTLRSGRGIIVLDVQVDDVEHLERVERAVRLVDGVVQVSR